MKINFNKDELSNAINIAQKAVSAKTTMNILECFLITASFDEIHISSNDSELAIDTVIRTNREREDGSPSCEVLEPGQTAIEARLFSEIVRKMDADGDTLISFQSDGNIACIKSGTSLFQIQEKDPEQFPEMPSVKEDQYICLSQFSLKEVIRDTIFSIAANDSNKLMTGEYFEVRGDRLRAVTLDGHRISIRCIRLKDDYGDQRAVIPGKTLGEIQKILTGEADKDVLIFFEDNNVMFRFEDTVMVSRLIDGEYFRVDSMLSSDYETKVVVNKKELLEHLERAMILIRESDKKPLVFTISDGTMNLRLKTVVGSLNSDLEVQKTGKDLMIGFNPKFILDALRVIDEEEVTLYMTNAKAPCFIRDEDGQYIYLILPINFNPNAY